MKILSVQERTVALEENLANASISFSSMTASVVVIEIETSKGCHKGLSCSSIGRYGHGGLLKERFIPRLLNAAPSDFRDSKSGEFSMSSFWNVLMANEKEGGHGERSGAVGVLETAMWDALAKEKDLPLWALLQMEFGHSAEGGLAPGQTRVYSSGGHYPLSEENLGDIGEEAQRAFDQGYGWFKLKVGGASEIFDKKRIEKAIRVAGDPNKIAVDANFAFSNGATMNFFQELDKLMLRWIEEPVNPLDYDALSRVSQSSDTSIATGENIFSVSDTINLLRYGGLKPGHDTLQMDINLSYGITEFIRIINAGENFGWSRQDFIPHAGHQVSLHMSAGLGLGGHEASANSIGPFGGVSEDTRIEGGVAYLGDLPGLGIEGKKGLYKLFDGLLG